MATLTFDSLKYARRLREGGVPEPQADVHAELMVEAFGFYADNILTKDHFEAVLDAKLDARFAEQDARLDKRFAEQEAGLDKRFAEQEARFDKRFTALEFRIGRLEDRMDSVEACIQNLTKITLRIERTQFVHSWILGIGVTALVVPQLNAWLV